MRVLGLVISGSVLDDEKEPVPETVLAELTAMSGHGRLVSSGDAHEFVVKVMLCARPLAGDAIGRFARGLKPWREGRSPLLWLRKMLNVECSMLNVGIKRAGAHPAFTIQHSAFNIL